MKLTKILENTTDNSIDEHDDLFMWEMSPKSLQEVDTVFIPQDANRTEIKAKLENALTRIEEEYHKIMAMFYYFDDKALGTISEKVLASLLEKTGIFKQGTVAQTGGSGKLSDLEVAGQGISLKTTLVGSAINLGSAAGEGGIKPGDSTLPNRVIKDKKLRSSRIPIKTLKTKSKQSWDAVDRKVKNICIKIGNDLFLWAAVSKDLKNKKLKGFTFYLLDLDGAALYNDIMKTGYMELQDSGDGQSFNIYTGDGKMFSKGDAAGKYFNLAPEFVKAQFDQADVKLKTEGKATVKTKDISTKYAKGTKVSIKVNPTADKGTKFNFDDISKQVFNAMLSVLTEPKNMQKIVSAIPIE